VPRKGRGSRRERWERQSGGQQRPWKRAGSKGVSQPTQRFRGRGGVPVVPLGTFGAGARVATTSIRRSYLCLCAVRWVKCVRGTCALRLSPLCVAHDDRTVEIALPRTQARGGMAHCALVVYSGGVSRKHTSPLPLFLHIFYFCSPTFFRVDVSIFEAKVYPQPHLRFIRNIPVGAIGRTWLPPGAHHRDHVRVLCHGVQHLQSPRGMLRGCRVRRHRRRRRGPARALQRLSGRPPLTRLGLRRPRPSPRVASPVAPRLPQHAVDGAQDWHRGPTKCRPRHPTPCTLHPTHFYTLHPALWTLNPTPSYFLNTFSTWSLEPRPWTLDPKT